MTAPAAQHPTVGRIVHYHHEAASGTFVVSPAIITAVINDQTVDLTVFHGRNPHRQQDHLMPAGVDVVWNVKFDPAPSRAYSAWTWPPRT